MEKYFNRLYSNGKKEFYKLVENKLNKKEKMFIITANAETFFLAKKDDEMQNIIMDKNNYIVADGISIVKSAQMLDYDINERITGIDLVEYLFELSKKHHYKLALLGASENVIVDLKYIINKEYPNIEIVKIQNGYDDNKEQFFKDLENLQPDVCLVALGIPQQEKIIYNHLNKFQKGIFIGVGGSFDVLSGNKKRAPKLFQKLNLEWLYRITKEPKRIKRFYENNIKFIFEVRKLKKSKNK